MTEGIARIVIVRPHRDDDAVWVGGSGATDAFELFVETRRQAAEVAAPADGAWRRSDRSRCVTVLDADVPGWSRATGCS
jgi:hypothetical protein